ncbi:Bug family tripartite tricarboxylate transporter substrate binding protein [Achromobacter spanius]|uniref:ABC transporter substrate-binding protein n=1 Tax=Achromobacter spanius TaxID=217203 RepID=A0A2S0IAL2_9BURK|nr:tripartite tricarboxylate transporter substrate binding protein [Achromobacter spanius]AVJ29046.1 ABC transporter substrate-binding protein [Achromobacter spanius]
MKKKILCTLLASAAAVLTALSGPAAAAQPTRLVVAFPPGGPADSLARLLAKELESELGRTVIVENKPGANGAIAATYVIRSPADGSVLFLSSAGAIAINPSLYPNLPYKPAQDLSPVALVVHTPEVLVVSPKNPIKTATDYVASAAKRKEPAALASSGVGSMPHMTIELLKSQTRIDFLHVAYKGAAPAIADTIGGHVEAFFGDVSGLMPFINDGQLTALGVAAPARLKSLPKVPTLAEQGIPNVEASNWYGVFAPKGTPADVVGQLNQAVRNSLKAKALIDNLASLGVEPSPSSPEEFGELVKTDTAKWAQVVKAGNVKAE